jgi:hypothetical protein
MSAEIEDDVTVIASGPCDFQLVGCLFLPRTLDELYYFDREDG